LFIQFDSQSADTTVFRNQQTKLKQHVKIKHCNEMLHYFVKVQPSLNAERYLMNVIWQLTESIYGHKIKK